MEAYVIYEQFVTGKISSYISLLLIDGYCV